MQPDLRPGQHLEKFIQTARAARQRAQSASAFMNMTFLRSCIVSVMTRVVEIALADLQRQEMDQDDTQRGAALPPARRARDFAHQTDITSAINQPPACRRNRIPRGPCGRLMHRIIPRARATKYAY